MSSYEKKPKPMKLKSFVRDLSAEK